MNNTDIEQIINDFNDMLKELALNIANICPSSIIGSNINLIENTIKNPNNKRKFIDIFVQKVLIYKPQILKGDEDFFLGKNYNDMVDEIGQNNKKDVMDKIFEFKELWKKLNRNNKNIVIQYMQLLCMLADKYFVIIDSNNYPTEDF